MRVRQHLPGIQTGTAGHAGIAHEFHHFVLGTLHGPSGDHFLHRGFVFPTSIGCRKARIGQQIGLSDDADKGFPHLRLAEDINVVVRSAGRTRERRARHGASQLVARTRRWVPEALVVAQRNADQIDHRVLHRHLHMLAFARGVPLLQRGQNTDRHVHPGAGVADRGKIERRRAVGGAGNAHRAAHGLGNRLEAFEIAVRPVGAEALDGGIDQPRVQFRQNIVPEAQTIQRTGSEILQQHVGPGNNLLEKFLALFGFQIQRQASFVGIEDQEKQAVAVGFVAHVGAGDVAAFRLLQLDHVGAKEAEDLGAGRAGLIMGHVDDTDAGEGLGHDFSSEDVGTTLPPGRSDAQQQQE